MTTWKTFVRATFARSYKYSGAMWLHERMLCRPFLTILLFHRVTDVIPPDPLTVSVSHFRRLCEMLRHGFRVVPLSEVFDILRAGRPMPRRTVAITFDDCYLDNLHAAEILRDYGFPATFFLPTSFVGTTRVFDWDRSLPVLGNLSWNHAREMVAMGHDVGSHTVTHANLGTVGPDEAWNELIDSRKILEDQLGRPCRWFAYPFGGPQHLRPEYVPLIERAGYEGAVSAFGGFVRPGMAGRVLPREAVPYFHSLDHLELHLSGCLHWWYDLYGRERALGDVPNPELQSGHVRSQTVLPAVTLR
jgi:peptidoglycan/xylan/chitin deacetylase (PgdA/CDA1 family)